MYDSPRLGDGDTIHTSFALPHAQEVRFSGSRRTVKVTIGDVDLPAFVSNGYVYIQAPLPLVFQAFGEDLSDFVRDLEVGISTTGAPHFHLVVMGVPFLARQWLSRRGTPSDDPRPSELGPKSSAASPLVKLCHALRSTLRRFPRAHLFNTSGALGHRWTKAPTFECRTVAA